MNLKADIAAELEIDQLRKILKSLYLVEMKKQEFGFSNMYLLCIDTTNKKVESMHNFDGLFIPFIILCSHFSEFYFRDG